ncbi:MAG: ATP-binding protein [bacterium]
MSNRNRSKGKSKGQPGQQDSQGQTLEGCSDQGKLPGQGQIEDPRSPVEFVPAQDVPCPFCGAMPRQPEVDFTAIRESEVKNILIRASMTIRLYPCTCRESAEAEQKNREIWQQRLIASRIPPRYWGASLQPTGKSAYEGQFIPVCLDYLKRVKDTTETQRHREKLATDHCPLTTKNGLGLIGSTGTGKTYYMCAVMLELMKRGAKCLFINLPEFYTQLKSAFGDEGTPEYSRLILEAKEAGVLGLDEIGQRKLSPWASEELYGIINYRYNYNLAILFTTSKSVEELGSTISRDTVDRLYEICTAYQITGSSLRREPQEQRD